MLGTLCDPNNCNFYNFYANPSGVPYSSRSVGLKWDGVYEVAASVAVDVWYAEMKIPYSSLNLTAKTPEFCRMDFERIKPGYIVWGGTSECVLTSHGMQPVGLPKVSFAEHCYRADVILPDGPVLGANALKATAHNTSREAGTVTATLAVKTSAGTTWRSQAETVVLPALGHKELSFSCPIAARGPHEAILELHDPKTSKLVCTSEKHFFRVPQLLETRLVEPHYRRTAYATDPVAEAVVTGLVTLGDMALVKKMKIEARLVNVERDKRIKKEKERASRTGEFTVKFPISELNDGEYRIELTLLDAAGKQVAAATETFSKVPRGENEIVVGKGNTLLVNGQPFFATNPFGGCPADQMKEFRFNCSGWTSNQKSLDDCVKQGLKGCFRIFDHRKEKDYPQSVVSKFKDHPGLLAWYLWDEPGGWGIHPKKLIQQYETIKKLDPYHPVIIVSYMPDVLSAYAPACDILAPDLYPIHHIRNVPMTWIAESIDRGAAAIGPGQCLWFVPQAFGQALGDWGRWALPTPEEERIMVYLGLIHGVKGLSYYVWNHAWCPDSPCWKEVKRIQNELAELAPMLLDGSPPAEVGVFPPNGVHVLAKRYEGRLYILTANPSKDRVSVEFQLPRSLAPNCRVEVPYEKRTLEAREHKFRDEFNAHSVHVYSVQAR